MEFLETELVHSGSAVVETERMLTPVSKTEKLAMLIHMIEMQVEDPLFSLASSEWANAVISKTSHEGDVDLPSYGDPDIMLFYKRWAREGLVLGPFSKKDSGHDIVYFDPPVLYAKTEIFLEFELSTNQTAGLVSACRIGYTLESVSQEDFIDALVE